VDRERGTRDGSRVGSWQEKRGCRRISQVFLALCTVVLVWQLFIPPALSVANDNDFQKLAGRYCLGGDPGTGPVLFDYTSLREHFSPSDCIRWPQRTVAEVPFILAMGLNRLFTSKSWFDLRWVGVVYGVIFLAGFAWMQHALSFVPREVSIAVQTAYLLVICNAVYVPWLNTLYFDALTFACLTGAIASLGLLVLRPRASAVTIIVTALWLAMVAGSKSQHAPIMLVFLPLLWLPSPKQGLRPVWARVAGTLLVIAGATLSLGTIPGAYRGMAPFNVLFYRILPSVPDPARYIAETRIPPMWVRYVGQHTFMPGSPLESEAAQEKFATWFDPMDLIGFYGRHPSLAWRLAEINLTEASFDRVRMKTGALAHRLGNYEKSAGKAPQALSHFLGVWPAIKHAIISGRPLVYLAWIIAVIGAAWATAPPVPRIRILLFAFTACLAVAWAIPMLDGLDAGRHLTVFNFLLDLMVCADVGFVVFRYTRQRNWTCSYQARCTGSRQRDW
jgi:hypothetical protein